MKVISSRENNLYKQTAKLLRKKSREETGLFLLEGTKPIRDALETGLMIEKIFSCKGKELPEWIPEDQCVILEEKLFSSLCDTVHSQGVIAVVRKPQIRAEDLMRRGGCIAVLDRLQDPGNAGTIIRTAEAAGFDGIIAMRGSVDLFAPKTVRSAAGSLIRMPVVTDLEEEELIRLTADHNCRLVVSALEDAEDCFTVRMTAPLALVIGNEGSGVSPGLLKAADRRVRIPMAGEIESLNAAVAAGVLMYQIRR